MPASKILIKLAVLAALAFLIGSTAALPHLPSAWVEDLQDEFSAWAFVTTEYTFIRVDLPRSGDMIVVDSPGPEEVKTLQACAHVK